MPDEEPDYSDACGATDLRDCTCGQDPNGGDGEDD
ncbi:hypothetical protein UFOVP253_68 [uncultured Caudovirales phage]|uniref:Uncharacterized protein n=1 Tax=uncultured Caudovirales phage TaxID=2100421 RepID=A0A6J5LHI9_9CAUD|nr:hypothetical protein UFOVP253_68 [uncultured Caudovirales phage]